jgi:hypothetical protein
MGKSTTDRPLSSSSSSPDAGGVISTPPARVQEQEASARRPVKDPSTSVVGNNEKENGSTIAPITNTSRMTIEATNGDPRSPSFEVRDFMRSLAVQDNINIMEPTLQPGAFLVGPINNLQQDDLTIPLDQHAHHDQNDDHNNNMLAATDASTVMIVAHLAPDEEEMRAQYREELETEVARIRETLVITSNDANIVVADEVKNEDALVPPGLNRRTKRWITVSIFLCLVVGAVLGGVVYSALQGNEEQGAGLQRNEEQGGLQNEEQGLDPLLEELRSLIAPTEDDLLPFTDPLSPQSQALAWLRDDPITLTPGRSLETALERYILAVLYYTTSGSFWYGFQLKTTDHCTWNYVLVDSKFGVFCDKDTGMMDNLMMLANNLFGTIPWELVLLTNLKTLDLGYNILAGTIPSRIAELTGLEYFRAGVNQLTGTLPPLFSPGMLGIDVAMNELNGTLPETWATGMPLLQILSMSTNRITGTLPTNIGLLSDLRFLGVSTAMTGALPTELGLLSSLQEAELHRTSFTGSVNETLCNISSLSVLWADCEEVECPCCTYCCFDDPFDCMEMLGDTDDGDGDSRN